MKGVAGEGRGEVAEQVGQGREVLEAGSGCMGRVTSSVRWSRLSWYPSRWLRGASGLVRRPPAEDPGTGVTWRVSALYRVEVGDIGLSGYDSLSYM